MNEHEKKIDIDKTSPELLADFLMRRFQKNIEALKKYFPNLASKFENHVPKKSMDFFCSQSGTPNMAFSDENMPFYEKHSSIKFLNFSMNSLSKLVENTTSFANQVDTSDPKEFCKYQVQELLKEKVLLRDIGPSYDPHGQIHFKYTNEMINIYRGKYQGDVCSLGERKVVPLLVCIGVGLGYQLEEMTNSLDIFNLILIEKDSDVFFASLHIFDWAGLIEKIIKENRNLTIIINENPVTIALEFYLFFINYGLFYIGAFSVHFHYDDESNKTIYKELENQLRYLPSAFGFIDDRIFGVAHTCHSITHKKHFVLKNKLTDVYKNVPVFIIGSGPSIDNDLSFIRKYQDKAIIIACGTAIDVLYHAGVKPDFYANTERNPEIEQALSVIPDKNFFDDIILLSSNVCHPNVVSKFKHTAIFGKWDENFADYLSKNLKLSFIQNVCNMNPLVGNMGVSGAITLGFKNIYLFGLDNGKKKDVSSLHSEHSSLYSKFTSVKGSSNYHLDMILPGNFGGECQTNSLYASSVKSIESLFHEIPEFSDVTCKNCSDGVLIRGTIPVHSSSLDEEFSRLENIDKSDFIRYMDNVKTCCFDVTEDQIKGVIHPQIYLRICSNMREMIARRPKDIHGFIKLFKDINSFLVNIRKDLSIFYSRTAESSIYSMLTIAMGALFVSRDKNECLKMVNALLDSIDDYLVEAPQLFEKLPDYVMREHRKYYPDGKVGKDMPHCKATRFPPVFNMLQKEFDDPQKYFVKRYS